MQNSFPRAADHMVDKTKLIHYSHPASGQRTTIKMSDQTPSLILKRQFGTQYWKEASGSESLLSLRMQRAVEKEGGIISFGGSHQ